MVLSTHYRTENNFSDEKVSLAVSSLARIYSSLALKEDILETEGVADSPLDPIFKKALVEAEAKIDSAFSDDFSTPEVFAEIFGMVRLLNSSYKKGQKVKPKHLAQAKAFSEFMQKYGFVMSLFNEPAKEFLNTLDQMLIRQKNIDVTKVDELIASRIKAREEKDWAKSDEIRDELLAMGVEIHDTPEGTHWEVAK